MIEKIDSTGVKSANDAVNSSQNPPQTKPEKESEPLLKMKTDEVKGFEVEHTEQKKENDKKTEEQQQKNADVDKVAEVEEELSVEESDNVNNSASIKNESYTDAQQLMRNDRISAVKHQSSALFQFVDTMEDESGNKIDEFLVQKYPDGTHTNANANVLYEDCNDHGKTTSVTGDVFLSHTNKKGATIIAGGAYEYKSSGSGEDGSAEKNGNVVLGYKQYFKKPKNGDITDAKYTGAVLASGNFNDGMQQFTGSVGVEHNPTSLAANYRVQAVRFGGETTFKKNFDLTFLDNDKSDEITFADELESDDKSEMSDELNTNEFQQSLSGENLIPQSTDGKVHKTKFGKYLAENKAAGYGAGVRFVLQNADLDDDSSVMEYGLVGNYSFSFLNDRKKYNSKSFVVTPSVGVIDAGNQLKLTSGIEADYKSKSPNGTVLGLNASVNNDKMFAAKNKPASNTFSASFTGKLEGKKVSASANATYIKSDCDMKSTSINANVEYRISEHIKASAQAGYTEYDLLGTVQNKCLQLGLGACINF